MLDGVPRFVLVLAVPVIAFLITIGISLGTSGSEENTADTPPSVGVSVSSQQPLPTATSSAAPTPTAASQAFRTDCAAIRGTDYRSGDERDWFQKNCLGSSVVSNSTSSSAASTNTTSSSAPRPAAAAATSGVEAATGQRLVIPKANVNTDIYITKMVSGDMPNPKGYFNALTYDMSALPGLGGDVNKGNLVLSGHVDCGRCYNGGSGIAVFWSVRQLSAGDTAQVIKADGSVQNYVVTSSKATTAQQDFSPYVASGAADMTIITCTGTFSGGEYDNRHVVTFKKA
jgi:sortase (surface protein transpeptidase)